MKGDSTLYTFVLDFKGGTYLSQVTAANFNDAPMNWARELKSDQIAGAVNDFRNKIISQISDEPPVEIVGLSNTWCLTFQIDERLAIVHFIETATTTRD